jgi:hypothetical protein
MTMKDQILDCTTITEEILSPQPHPITRLNNNTILVLDYSTVNLY